MVSPQNIETGGSQSKPGSVQSRFRSIQNPPTGGGA